MAQFNLEIKGSAAALDAYLNEYHLYSSPGAGHSYSTNMRAWMAKENLIRIKASHSAKAREGDPVQFSSLATSSEGSARRTLAQMSFPGDIAPPDVATLPYDTLGKTLSVGHSLHFLCEDLSAIVEKPWYETGRLVTNPNDVIRLYAEIQNSFLAGSVEQVLALSRARISFGARLFDKPRGVFEKQVHDNLTRAFARQPIWKKIERPELELTVHEFLPGKVMRVLDLHGNPPLRTVADKDGFQFGYDIIVAMTGDGLVWIM